MFSDEYGDPMTFLPPPQFQNLQKPPEKIKKYLGLKNLVGKLGAAKKSKDINSVCHSDQDGGGLT